MDDSTIQGEANSWSVSKSSISDPDLKTRDSGSSTSSSKSTHGQDESTTPTGQPRHSGQQSSAMPAMAPPPKPNFKATPTSAQPSQPANSADPELPFVSAEPNRNGGRQPATSSKHLAKETVQATPRKRSHVEVDRQQAADDDDSTDEDNEPAVSIAAFDWMELESRYHQQMDQYRAQEQDLYRSFDELIQYFYVWAETGQGHEVDRSFKRMKTQITLVQHNEEELESRRQHYVKVVDAFKSALQLLTGD